MLDSESQEEELAVQINSLVDFLEERSEIAKQLRSSCRVDIVCSFSSEAGQGGIVLSHTLLKRLGQENIDLKIDLFPPGKEKGEPEEETGD